MEEFMDINSDSQYWKKQYNNLKIWLIFGTISGGVVGFSHGINHSFLEHTDPKNGDKHRFFIDNSKDSLLKMPNCKIVNIDYIP